MIPLCSPPSRVQVDAIVTPVYHSVFPQDQRREFLDGFHGMINIANDICIFGCGNTKEEADIDRDRSLMSLLDKCSDHDLRLSTKKLQFKSSSVTFMGHKLTDKGVEPDPSKVAAIKEMPRPTDRAGWVCVNTLASSVTT